MSIAIFKSRENLLVNKKYRYIFTSIYYTTETIKKYVSLDFFFFCALTIFNIYVYIKAWLLKRFLHLA